MDLYEQGEYVKKVSSKCDLLKTKQINIYRYQTTNLLKTWFLFLLSTKGQKKKKNKPQFVVEIAGIIVTIFSYKNVSQTASKTFAKQCSLY